MSKTSSILVVDDSNENLFSIVELLANVEVNVITATTGNDALIATLNHSFALILLDVNMPEMDGYELAELIRGQKETVSIPIIFFSAAGSTSFSAFKGHLAGAVDFMAKPIDPRVLENKVNFFIELDQQKKYLNDLLQIQQNINDDLLKTMDRLKTTNTRLEFELSEQEQVQVSGKRDDAKFESICANAPIIVNSVNDAGQFTMWNHESERLLGHTRDEVLNSPHPLQLIFPNEDDYQLVHESIKKKDGVFRPFRPSTKSGEIREQMWAFFEDDDKNIFGFGYDITEQKKLENELKAAKVHAEMANRTKTKFLANLTHDIRTPLNSIKGFSQLLIQKGEKLDLPNEFQEFQKNIQSGAHILSEMIDNFLDLSKIEAGKMVLSEEDFSIRKLIQSIFDNYSVMAQQKGVDFSFNLSSKLPESIRCDRVKLNQVLTNLVGNAIKFTPENKSVKIQVAGDDQVIAFMVIDQGIGIPEEQQNRIFDPFEQIDSNRRIVSEGTGLGLSISHALVGMLGGRISLVSQVGKGSNFNVLIPYKAVLSPVLDEEVCLQTPTTISQNKNILVVEDNLTNQALIEAVFDDIGLPLQFANDGREGVAKAIELEKLGKIPDLILMDMQMPDMDGIETTLKIREMPAFKNVPIVALSANAFSEQQEIAISAGMNDYLTKPIEIEKLHKVLNKYLHQ